ncbi:enoyl-[acyl-carrier-protein] reductase, mitochondrial [Triplophysa rosa]|nr:enoyl-[acyl-carrier-protein] reductase, mitochondrial [Triplophysa rosa]XP_057209597.1 enoyl-[acyl-carrier-protein] reductase, mitochondrial [Triplophysa rosa]
MIRGVGHHQMVLLKRCCRSVHHCSALIYRQHSRDEDTVRMEEMMLRPVRGHDVRLKMLAAPVNPADINMIQGSYPILCPLPAVGGNEGVGEVIEVGSDVTALKPGDWVVPIDAGFGTWRTGVVCKDHDVMSVCKHISVLGAATVFVNPCTAYRMLKDFQSLTPGCTVLQNGSNSAVGRAVIQMASALGLQTINIIRDRPNCAELTQELKSVGADYVLTEEEVMSSGLSKIFKEVPKPKLGLNCVGGSSGGLVLSNLDHGGTMITYGGMARKPLQIPTKSLIFQNVTLKGFWLTQWKKNHRKDEVQMKLMLDHVCDLMRDGRLTAPPCVPTPFHQYTRALHATVQSHQRKHVLIM